MKSKATKITAKQAQDAAALILHWAYNQPFTNEKVAKTAASLLEIIQDDPDCFEADSKKLHPSKLDLVEMMMDYCKDLPKDFEECEFDISPYVKSVGYRQGGIGCKSILGEEWETDDGRRFCFVALCAFNPNQKENQLKRYDIDTGTFESYTQFKNGYDSSNLGFASDYADGVHWSQKSFSRTILRFVGDGAICYQSWTRELIHFTRASNIKGSKIRKDISAFFQMAAAAAAISEHNKTA